MDEMALLQHVGRGIAAEDLQPPAELREQVFSRATTAAQPELSAVRSLPSRARHLPRGRRILLGAAAAGVAAVLIVAPTLRAGTGAGRQAGSAAAAVFDQAARKASSRRAPNVPPGSFVYVKSIERSIAGIDGDHPGAMSDERRIWLSAHGDSAGLLQGRSSGDKKWTSTPLEDLSPPLHGAYRDDLPTTTTAMYQYIYHHLSGSNPPDVEALETVIDLVNENYLPPATLAALFRAAARIPGTRVISGQRDALGRPAIALAQPGTGSAGKCKEGEFYIPGRGLEPYCAVSDMLFDPVTYEYLGRNEVLSKATRLGPAGTVTVAVAVQPPMIVARVGQLP